MTAKSKQTESRLFDCALSLFAEKGYAATSVRDIIEAVGLAKPVLYYYCKNKADLFEQLVRRTHDDAYTELEQQIEGTHDLKERLRLMIVETFAFCNHDYRLPRFMFQIAYGPRTPEVQSVVEEYGEKRFSLVERVMREGQADRQLNPEDDPKFLALTFCSLMDHPLNVLSSDPKNAEKLTPELAEALLQVFLRGVSHRG